jgi:hypothetical protein
MNLRSLTPNDFERTVWRYMPLSKFVSLLTYQALWFSKLNILQDRYEGLIPRRVRERIHEKNQEYKVQFDTPEFHRQIDEWPSKNESDGRELYIVTCWFLDEQESSRMWKEYGVSNEAVAVKSTIGSLAQYVFVRREPTVSHLGPVSYVDHESYEMSSYEAHQAIERSFLKDKSQFCHEQEIRLVTLNVKTTSCASPEGRPYTTEQVAGAKMNNFENPGLFVGVDLKHLIREVVVCPGAQPWFTNLIRRLVELHGLTAQVMPSALGND